MGRSGIKVEVSAGEREQLASMSRWRSLPHSLVRQAKIVLIAADGHHNLEIAAQCGVMPPAVTAHGLAGLHDQATTTLIAALNTATGEIIAQCKRRHRHQKFISFLNHIDRAVPAMLDVHMIVGNYATHKHPKVKAWLAKRTSAAVRIPAKHRPTKFRSPPHHQSW